MKTKFEEALINSKKLYVHQVIEAVEIITGFETRNKYQIFDEEMKPLAYAGESSTGFRGALIRGMLRHWRTFQVVIFDQDRKPVLTAKFPFRWFFKTLYLEKEDGTPIGHLQARFAFFYKKFELYGANGDLLAQVKSPFFKIWTFEFKDKNRKLGTVKKKWSGAMSELFTDRDNFTVSFAQTDIPVEIKSLMLAACLMVDVIYFEKK